jgi:hypothetical protein
MFIQQCARRVKTCLQGVIIAQNGADYFPPVLYIYTRISQYRVDTQTELLHSPYPLLIILIIFGSVLNEP